MGEFLVRHLVDNRWDMLTVEHDVTTLSKTEGVGEQMAVCVCVCSSHVGPSPAGHSRYCTTTGHGLLFSSAVFANCFRNRKCWILLTLSDVVVA